MLDLTFTRLVHTNGIKAASGANIVDEGQALVMVDDGGEAAVAPSTGSAGERFYGVAMFGRQTPTTLPGYVTVLGTGEEFTQELAGLVSGSEKILVDGEAVDGTTPEATISGTTLTVTADAAEGTVITVVYTYEPNISEVLRLVGTTFSETAIDYGALMGVGRQGVFFVSNYDTSADYEVGQTLKLGANGTFTTAGSGEETNAVVTSVPRDGQAFLGFELV